VLRALRDRTPGPEFLNHVRQNCAPEFPIPEFTGNAKPRRLGPLGHRCIWTLDHRLWTDVPAWTERFDALAQHQTEFLAALA